MGAPQVAIGSADVAPFQRGRPRRFADVMDCTKLAECRAFRIDLARIVGMRSRIPW